MQQALQQLQQLQSLIENSNIEAALQILADTFPGAVTFSTSFSNEDQVIAHHILQSKADISVFTLDTGRLFQATYDVWQETVSALGLEVKAYYPEPADIQSYTKAHGPNGFYESLESRLQCCHIRKVAPLKKALAGKSVWITGLRAEHAPNRSSLSQLEWDEHNEIIKFHPLFHWSTEQVSAYIREQQLPYNKLSEKGFVSIGCEPCTRAIRPGEEFRAGRWWWEDSGKKECGLHAAAKAVTQ
jgi:phosphoadenosine phosphosulfate reductase